MSSEVRNESGVDEHAGEQIFDDALVEDGSVYEEGDELVLIAKAVNKFQQDGRARDKKHRVKLREEIIARKKGFVRTEHCQALLEGRQYEAELRQNAFDHRQDLVEGRQDEVESRQNAFERALKVIFLLVGSLAFMVIVVFMHILVQVFFMCFVEEMKISKK